MKRLSFFIPLLFILFASFISGITGCGSENPSNKATVELSLRQRVSGTISTTGAVHWYHYRAVEANNILQVTCYNNTYRSDIELLITVYQADAEGNLERLYADHTPDGSIRPADIKMNVYIDAPKDIYISVRDLMDDESSTNPYYLSVDFASNPDGNENFAEAVPLVVDGADSSDCIGYIGDVDCYKFAAPEDGIYEILINLTPFSGGTAVELAVDLYNIDGALLESLAPLGLRNNLTPYLRAGEYYVLIDDYGRDDFDSASIYEIGVRSVSSDEKYENDTMEEASAMQYDQDNRSYSVNGFLDYWGDKDWYRFSMQDSDPDGFTVLLISFDGEAEEDLEENLNGGAVTYQINVEDSGENVLLSHSYRGGSSTYKTQIKAGAGDHYLMVQAADGEAQKSPYHVSIQLLDVIDEAEGVVKLLDPVTGQAVLGNNTIDTADVLIAGITIIAKIGYRGDEDWYRLHVENTTDPDGQGQRPRVLEVFLDTNSISSQVDYSLTLMRDSIIRKTIHSGGGSVPAELKMSILVPPTDSPVFYFFKAGDYQGDDGDGLTDYRIRAELREIPESLPPGSRPPAIDPNLIVYYSEAAETADETATTVELEHNSLIKKNYRVNTTLLNFQDPNRFHDPNGQEGISIERNGDLATISFPWIGGYIDFQGDQDWFQLDLGPLALSEDDPPDQQWYYDIKIDLHVGDPGSSVEYVWKLYRDRNQNKILADRPHDSNGFMASAGDLDTGINPLDITIPSEGQQFWVGDAWKGKFYLSIGDFNYVNSKRPDDDWGYAKDGEGAPYYFRLTLVYHSGQSYPQ